VSYKRRVEPVITLSEAAEILDVSVRQVRNYITDGTLVPTYPEGRKLNAPILVSREDVAALAEFLGTRMGIAELASIARRAYVSSRSLERVVRRINTIMGANIPIPNLGKEEILETYLKIEQALEDDHVLTADEVTEWARVFYAAGEEYFEAVAEHTASPEPWKNFLALASKLKKEAPTYTADSELTIAFNYIAVATRFMRQAAYFYVRNKHGLRVAGRMFPETADDIVAPVLAMAFD
jgi:hypothetical protein